MMDDMGIDSIFTSASFSLNGKLNRNSFEKTLEKLDRFYEFHFQMSFTLQKNLDLLKNFIQNYNFTDENPIEEFLINDSINIYESWIFNNINFEKIKIIKLIEDENFPNVMKKYIYQNTTNKFKNFYVKKIKNNEKNLEFDLQLIYENQEIIEKLIIKELELNDITLLLERLNQLKVNMENIKIVKIINSNLKNTSIKWNGSLLQILERIKKLIFNDNSMNLNMLNLISFKSAHLNTLCFRKCSLNNLCTEKIFNLLLQMNNLEKLDLSHNHFTIFDIESLQPLVPHIFNKLEVLNLKHNNIYSIKINRYFPNIKYLDLSSNNFSLYNDLISYQSFYEKDSLIIASRNLFLFSNSKLLKHYVNYLNSVLVEYEYKLTKLDLSYLNNFNDEQKESSNFLDEIKINKKIQYSIKKINLSCNKVFSRTLTCFFSNNQKLMNLKALILRNNNIEDDFLKNFLFDNNLKALTNLEYLDLSQNCLSSLESLMTIYNILKGNKQLKIIKLNLNELEILFNNYILLIVSESQLLDPELDLMRKFICSIKQLTKKSLSIVFSSQIERNIIDFLKKNGLDHIFSFG